MATYIKEQVGEDGVCCEDCAREGPCDGCTPTCPATTLLCATASASNTKCGFLEFGTPSSPPKVYLKKTASGSANSYNCDCTSANLGPPVLTATSVISGSADYDKDSCACVSGIISTDTGYNCDGDVVSGPVESGKTCSIVGSIVDSKTQSRDNFDSEIQVCDGSTSGYSSGDWIFSLSVEFTDEEIIDKMLSNVGTPGTLSSCGTSIIASFSLSSDGLTASGKRGEYAFPIPEDAPACYKITWDRVETPSTGSPTVTPMSYTWDGVATQTPTYSEDVPGDNTAAPGYSNAITIENIVVTCTGCA